MTDPTDRRQHVPQPGDIDLGAVEAVAAGARTAAALAGGIIAAAHRALHGAGDAETFVVRGIRGLEPDEVLRISISRERQQPLPEPGA